MKGWARVMGGRILHYYERTAYFGRSISLCGAKGVVRSMSSQNQWDNWISYPKCKKCLSKLEGEK